MARARAEKALDERSVVFFSALSEKEQAELGELLMRLIPCADEDESVTQ